MPGETQNDVDREFFNWLQSLTTLPGSPLPHCPKVDFPIRWLPGSSVAGMEPLVQELAACVTCTLCAAPCIVDIKDLVICSCSTK
jgi:hypothetical protein